MVATDWERNLSHGCLSPTQTERAVAPERVRTSNSELRVQSGLFKEGKFSQSWTILYNDMLFLYWPTM